MNGDTEGLTNIDAVKLLKIPPFWRENSSLWFIQLEAVFSESRITSDLSKFNYVVMHLDQSTLSFVADIVQDPPQHDKYKVIKNRIIKEFSDSNETKFSKLMQQKCISQEKPSVFLREIRHLAGKQFPEDYLRMYFLERLPRHIRHALLINGGHDLSGLADLGDKIWEADKLQVDALKTFPPDFGERVNCEKRPSADEWQEMVKEIECLKRQVNGTRREPYSRYNNNSNTSKSESTYYSNVCFYHRRFGRNARKCEAPCKYYTRCNQGNEIARRQ